MTDKIYNALFICSGNSARSIMTAVSLNRPIAGHWPRAGEINGPEHKAFLGLSHVRAV